LLYLGWKTFTAKLSSQSKKLSHTTLFNDFISTFFLTITNPMTILSFLAVFAGLGLSSIQGDYTGATQLVLGVFIGSAIWWLILSEGITLFRKTVSQKVMIWVNRVAGLVIGGFGIVALLSIIVQ
jgi:threonine/homoserine/homoserine lactone efflux protein